MIGTCNDGPIGIAKTVTSYRELVEIFGPEEVGFSLHKEAKQAFLNGVFQVVATRVGGAAIHLPLLVLKGFRKRSESVKLTARDIGEAGNRIEVKVMRGASENTVRLEISDALHQPESFDNVNMNKEGETYLVNIINQMSKIVSGESLIESPTVDNNPIPTEATLGGGTFAPPTNQDYERALEFLELEQNIDVVYICDNWNPEIHALVDAHCKNMSLGKEPKPLGPRIGIGTVAPNEPVDQIIKRTEVLQVTDLC